MLFLALVQEWTRLAELVQTLTILQVGGGSRMHWAEGERDRTFMQRNFRLCISVADGLNAGLQAQRWHIAWQQKVRTHCVPKVTARENLPERT